MKKIFSTLLILILLLALPVLASAEKNKWKTNDYDFASVHNVIIAEPDINVPTIDGYIADPFSQNKIEASLRQALEKRKTVSASLVASVALLTAVAVASAAFCAAAAASSAAFLVAAAAS